jgi:multiple sugar transport system ATP-binding protein
MLGLSDLLERKPKALSGGQRQRVAVGRAIVRKPAVFLFDEPLSNLDAKMRVEMRVELNKLHRRLATTMVYVTHDQVEAMTLGDRIVVMHQGEAQQVGAPLTVYDEPYNQFVAGFIGTPPMNFLEGVIAVENGRPVFSDGAKLKVPIREDAAGKLAGREGQAVRLGIRPEHVHDRASGSLLASRAEVRAKVEVIEALGHEKVVHFSLPPHRFLAKFEAHVPVEVGEETELVLDASRAQVFDQAGGLNLTCRAQQHEKAAPRGTPLPRSPACR